MYDRAKDKVNKYSGKKKVAINRINQNNDMPYKTQALKQAAIDAQQLIVNAAVGQPAVNDANEKLAEIKSATVTG